MHKIHNLANIVPMANELEQVALMADIKENGQKETAKLWRGKIVDGRCRQLACTTLGLDLKVEYLDDKLEENEVRIMVKSWNTRRNLTMTQKVISAHRDYLAGYGTLSEIAVAWAISRRTLANANYIGEHRPELITPLFNGNSVNIYDYVKGMDITTNRVNTVAKNVRADIDRKTKYMDESEEVTYTYSVSEMPFSAEVHAWIGKKMGEYSRLTDEGKEMMMKAKLLELAKYKEKSKDDNAC